MGKQKALLIGGDSGVHYNIDVYCFDIARNVSDSGSEAAELCAGAWCGRLFCSAISDMSLPLTEFYV